jgi:hypothetical protein
MGEAFSEDHLMKIIWMEWKTVPDEHSFGHGVHFHDSRKSCDMSLVAWLEGYEWLHGNPDTVQIWCITPDAITTASSLTVMKRDITAYVQSKKVPCGKISPNIQACPNA